MPRWPAKEKPKPTKPSGPCIVCKRWTTEIVNFGDKDMFMHFKDCQGPTL